MPKYTSLSDRIEKLSKLNPETGCIEWQGFRDKDGYPKIGVYEGIKQKTKTVTRVVWELHNGPLLPEELICHRCDNPPCVNIEHLFKGSGKDNAQDKKQKGRCVPCPGEKNGRAKLTKEQAITIREEKGTIYGLAKKYGVSRPTIKRIKNGETWSHA